MNARDRARIARLERGANSALQCAKAAASIELACVALAAQTADHIQQDYYRGVAEREVAAVREFAATAQDAADQIEEIRHA